MTAAKPRVRRPAHETKALILNTARADLLEHDNEPEVNRIAKRAGLSEGIVHYHFGNRAGLLAALVQDHYNRIDTNITLNRFDGKTWAEREYARISAMAQAYYADPVARRIASIVRTDPTLQSFETERIAKMHQVGARNIMEAQYSGEISKDIDPLLLVSMLLSSAETALILAASKTPPVPLDFATEQVYQFVLRAAGVAPIAK